VEGEPAAQTGWVLAGRVRRAISFSPREIDFTDRLVRGQPFEPEQITVNTLVPIRRIEAECSEKHAVVQVRDPPDGGKEYRLQVAPNSELRPGPFEFEILVRSQTEGGEDLPAIPVTARGAVVEDLMATPAALLLGTRSVGECVEETVILESRSGQPFEILETAMESENCTIDPVPQGETSRATLRIRQGISAAGAQVGTIRIRARMRNETNLTLPVRISYHGLVANSPGDHP
jgi:hypothetical protein